MAYLESNDLHVEKGVAGMPTAFIPTFGRSKPVIAIYGEYDALAGLSQRAGALPSPLVEGAPGHNCGQDLVKGLWYRSMFGHSGWCAILEDWFDPRRARDDYVPTGFKPYGAKTYAVKGHPFGLDLSADDKKALIAFLKTL
jgi:hypothetical protein